MIGQTINNWIALPPQVSVTNGATNGMWFTAPSDFVIKALMVPHETTNPYDAQSIAVIKFTGTGPMAFLATNYSVLFLIQDTVTPDSIPVNISIQSGDHIGILGSRWNGLSGAGESSNAGVSGFSTSINGMATPLYKLQANSPLNNQAPSGVYMPSPTSPIVRIEMYIEECILPNPNSVSIINNACYGDSSGAISATITGAYAPFIMEWSTGDSNINNISNLVAGNYHLTITDSSGCVFDTTINVSQPDSISSELTLIEPLCYGESNGSIGVISSGGTSPFSYSWNTGQTNNSLNLIESGVYTITISDSNNCMHIRTITLNEPELLEITLDSIVPNKCDDDFEGALFTTVSGGTNPYNYVWSDTAATNNSDISNLFAGLYTLDVTDLNGCSTSLSETIPVLYSNPVFDLGPAQTMPPANFALTLNGPLGFSSYLWSTGATTSYAYILVSGLYWLNVTDENTCHSVDSIQILPYSPAPEGIEVLEGFKIEIFPNPAFSTVFVRSSNQEISRIDLFNASGQIIRSKNYNDFQVELDVTQLPSGLYYLRINGKSDLKTILLK